MPEKLNLEITEVFSWTFKKGKSLYRNHLGDWINRALMDSLKRRTVESIDDNKITAWIRSKSFSINDDDLFHCLAELTAIPNHPFNSDRLHGMLLGVEMPKRDAFWQTHLRYFTSTDDNGNGHPLSRLIDWSWQKDISDQLESETARLTGQTLCWLLASTNRNLRDGVTKALVNLLEKQPKALIDILKAFAEVDDMYVIERMYAVAYGCVLRNPEPEVLEQVGQYVYNEVFKSGKPHKHILLRDYARNTVELAIHYKASIDIDMGLLRPPYHSRMPENMPSEKELKKYSIERSDPKHSNEYKNSYNSIHYSVISWDFGRYTVDGHLRSFYPLRFTAVLETKDFLSKISVKLRKKIKQASSMREMEQLYVAKRKNLESSLGKEDYEKIVETLSTAYSAITSELQTELSSSQYDYFVNSIIDYIDKSAKLKLSRHNDFDTQPIKRWIVQRVFELGFNPELHSSFDSNLGSYNRHNNTTERIGKKYQWIAFYEIASMITDNYKIKDEWSNSERYEVFPGAWRNYFRNVDPAFVTKGIQRDDDDVYEEDAFTKGWWFDIVYNFWNQPTGSWIKNEADMPDLLNIIQRQDPTGKEWVYLKSFITWNEPKPVGVDKYVGPRKEIWYLVQSYLVKKKDKDKTLAWLKQQNFRGRWLPENNGYSSLFNRENYWSPAAQEQQKHKKEWEAINDETRLKVIITTDSAVGEMSEDKSGAHFSYDMPCRTLFEGMGLQYADNDGEMKGANGETGSTTSKPQMGAY